MIQLSLKIIGSAHWRKLWINGILNNGRKKYSRQFSLLIWWYSPTISQDTMQHMMGGIFPPIFLCYLAAMPEDFSLNDFGPIVLLQPKTEFAFSWAQEN